MSDTEAELERTAFVPNRLVQRTHITKVSLGIKIEAFILNVPSDTVAQLGRATQPKAENDGPFRS